MILLLGKIFFWFGIFMVVMIFGIFVFDLYIGYFWYWYFKIHDARLEKKKKSSK